MPVNLVFSPCVDCCSHLSSDFHLSWVRFENLSYAWSLQRNAYLQICVIKFFFHTSSGVLGPIRPTLLKSLISKLIFCWGYIICTNSGVFLLFFVILEELDNENTHIYDRKAKDDQKFKAVYSLILEIMLYQQCMCFAMHKTWCLLCTVFIFSLY